MMQLQMQLQMHCHCGQLLEEQISVQYEILVELAHLVSHLLHGQVCVLYV